jgi:hypothetical protein
MAGLHSDNRTKPGVIENSGFEASLISVEPFEEDKK